MGWHNQRPRSHELPAPLANYLFWSLFWGDVPTKWIRIASTGSRYPLANAGHRKIHNPRPTDHHRNLDFHLLAFATVPKLDAIKMAGGDWIIVGFGPCCLWAPRHSDLIDAVTKVALAASSLC